MNYQGWAIRSTETETTCRNCGRFNSGWMTTSCTSDYAEEDRHLPIVFLNSPPHWDKWETVPVTPDVLIPGTRVYVLGARGGMAQILTVSDVMTWLDEQEHPIEAYRAVVAQVDAEYARHEQILAALRQQCDALEAAMGGVTT